MHSMFEEKYPDTHVSLHQYRDVFRSRFNLKFGLPRSDTCQKCDRYFVQLSNATTAEETRRIEFETNLHHRKAEQAYAVLREDIEIARQNNSVVVLCADMQQVLFSPMLTHSNVFYQRQFSTYNYCVSNAGSGQVTMHLWHEGVANRGASEVASCLFSYIMQNFKPLSARETRSLIVWSDRCVSQNNNHKMLSLLRHFVLWGYFSTVEQKFLCSGHSFLPCDTFRTNRKTKKKYKS